MRIAEAPATRGPIKLSPGLIIEGETVTEATVRMLTRADHALARKMSEGEREDFLFTRCVVSLGDCRDATIIKEALDFLRSTDEARLRLAVVELEADHMEAPDLSPEERAHRLLPAESDIRTEVFALNPGFTYKGKEYKTASVRLLTRGQWRRINQEPDLGRRDDLTMLFALAEIGGEQPTQELIDCITDVDNERINQEGEGLRAQYAPSSKSPIFDGDPEGADS